MAILPITTTASEYLSTQKQAEQGNTGAMYKLGRKYQTGDGVKQNDIKSVYWYTMARENGHPNATVFFGRMYYNGDSVTKNYRKAAEYLKKSAEQGNEKAQEILGIK